MKLITKELQAKLEAGHKNENLGKPAIPVLKLFNPTGRGTWIVSSIDCLGNMFCLADLGQGFPELGYTSIHELSRFKGLAGLGIERDKHWTPKVGATLSDYANIANDCGHIKDYI